MRLEFRISKLETGISVAGHLAALVSLLLMDLADHWQFSLIAVLAVNFGLQLSRILMRRPGSIRGLRFGIEQVLLVTRDGQIPAQVNRVVYQNPFLMVVEFRHLEDGEPLRRVPFGRKVISRLVVVPDSLPEEQLRLLAGFLKQHRAPITEPV